MMRSAWQDIDSVGLHCEAALRSANTTDVMLDECDVLLVETSLRFGCMGVPPVSYTHLTLPTICSV
eukprot:9221264-Alexandrium_andersonii.AAC.1